MKKQAVLIGINQYQILPELKFARQDAEATSDALKRNYCFADNEVTLLTDCKSGYFNPSSGDVILDYLEKLADQYLDLFIFGFWGHGLYYNGKRYLCPINVLDEKIEKMGVSLAVLQEAISQIKANNTCLILDCCQTAYGRGKSNCLTGSDQTALSNVPRDIVLKRKQRIPEFESNVAVLNSCKQGQSAYEWDSRQHGIFTAHLLDAMNNRCNSVAQIVSYLGNHVTKTAMELGKRQTPFYKLEGDILLPTNQGTFPVSLISKKNNSIPVLNTPVQSKLLSVVVPKECLTLKEACDKVVEGGTIYLESGTYTLDDTITINRNISVRSLAQEVKDVEIRCQKDVFRIISISPQFIGLTIHAKGENACGLNIESGTPIIQSCDIISDKYIGACIHGKNANPEFKFCQVYQCGQCGVIFYDNGAGELNNCNIYENTLAGMAICKSGNPIVKNSNFYSGKEAGIWVYESGIGEFHNCDIYDNASSGITVSDGGASVFRDCKIHDGKSCGAYILNNGAGQFNFCEFYQNALSGIIVETGGNPQVNVCSIYGENGTGIYIQENGKGKFHCCDLHSVQGSGIVVCKGGNPSFTKCKVRASSGDGVIVSDNGLGEFCQCEIYTNKLSGFNIQRGGYPIVSECLIHDGKGAGVFVHKNGGGKIHQCQFFRNELSAIQVCTGGNVIVTQCDISGGRNGGVYIYDKGSGTFNNNVLSENYTDKKEDNWDIRPTAGKVTGKGNQPKLPFRFWWS